jgi:hypothetical protein
MLMLPARDPSLLASGAALFDRAALTGVGPVAAQNQSILFINVMVSELLSGRTAVHVLVTEINKVLLAEATLGLNARGDRFGKRYGDAGFVTREDLLTALVRTFHCLRLES